MGKPDAGVHRRRQAAEACGIAEDVDGRNAARGGRLRLRARSTSLLAGQAPWWEPGAASGYHAMTYGHLIGEVIRRITGLKLGQFVASEIAGPLGADFHIGLDPTDDHRVSSTCPRPCRSCPGGAPDVPTPPPIDPDSVPAKTFSGPPQRFDIVGEKGWLRADIGAANGQGNARSVARIQSVVSNGGEVDGIRLLSPATIDLIFAEQANGVDLAIGLPLSFGVGYGLPQLESVGFIPEGRRCYWIGADGSTVVNDVDNRMTVAYVPNRLSFDLPMGSQSGARTSTPPLLPSPASLRRPASPEGLVGARFIARGPVREGRPAG